jgi:nitrite reductase/ring-hydroxylating ferredoxin subunit
MILSIEELNSPPVIGEIYLVPCVYGQITLLSKGQVKQAELWPIMRPSHQDSYYYNQTRYIWKDNATGYEMIEEEFYEDDPSTPHHYHVDPRFAPKEFYTEWEILNNNLHNVIDVQSEVQWKEMICLREMPKQRLFTGFGKRFVEDHKKRKIICGRCPHRGVLLNSIPIEDGIITCPNHGLQFNAETKECIS